MKMPHSKFKTQKSKQPVFYKRRKVSIYVTKRRRKTLPRLLEKGVGLINKTKGIYFSKPITQRVKTIRKVYLQQFYLIENNITKIVSLSPPRTKPII